MIFKDKLKIGAGQTVFTTIQKFQEKLNSEKYPELSNSADIFVLVDEAHRTQYRKLAINMRTSLPNACFLGFTGTPIDKRDRSTVRTFGPYIDTYTIEQSVEDKSTVPIFYEGRLPELEVEGHSIDDLFNRMFKDYPASEQERIKNKYATEHAIASAPKRVEAICLDILDHYEKFVQPNGFKAQIVTCNRATAVRYKEAFDRINAPESAVVISGGSDDPEHWRDYTQKNIQDRVIEQFKDPNHPLSLLVVCDMLLTGFDAPIEQMMYLDKPLKEHNLLQAIARVNRPYLQKDFGLIIDYLGVSRFLEKALEIFNKVDVKEAMFPIDNILPELEAAHREAMSFFEHLNLSAFADPKSFEDACVDILEPEDTRARFDAAFRKFKSYMEFLLPKPEAEPYLDDLKYLGNVRVAASRRYRDQNLDLSICGAKVRKLIEDHIRALGVDPLIPPVSILASDFEEKIGINRPIRARASEMEHAARYEIKIRFQENPEFYISLRERLEELIRARKEARITDKELIEKLRPLMEELRSIRRIAERMGLNEDEFAFYKTLEKKVKVEELEFVNEETKNIARAILSEILKLTVIDWTIKEDIQRRMRKMAKRILRQKTKLNREEIEELTTQLIELARVRLKDQA